jgi:hypothetical protein
MPRFLHFCLFLVALPILATGEEGALKDAPEAVDASASIMQQKVEGQITPKVELQMGSRLGRFKESERSFLKRIGGLLKNKYRLHHKGQQRNRGSPECRHLKLLERSRCEKNVDMRLLHDKTWVVKGKTNAEMATAVTLDHD